MNIFKPFYNILALLVILFKGNIGWAIFTFAILFRLFLLPLNRQTMIAQDKFSKLQPKMKEIHDKYKQDPVQANKETVELFKQEQVNFLGLFLGPIIQLVFVIFFYFFFKQAIDQIDWTPYLYSFIRIVPVLNYQFLALINLKAISLPLTFLFAAINSVLIILQPSMPGQNKTLFILLPFVIVFSYKMFPAAIILYWVAISLIGILEALINKKLSKKQKTI